MKSSILLNLFLLLSFFVVAQKKDTLSLLLANVSKKSLQKNIYFLAGDSCQGRMAATHGDSVATIFVEKWMKQTGLKAGASKNSFRQDVPLIDYVTNTDEMDIDGESEKKFDSWFYYGFQKFLEKELIIKNVPAVFINYGLYSEKYKDYDNIDIRNKVVVLLAEAPKYLTDSIFSIADSTTWWVKQNKIMDDKGALAYCIIAAGSHYTNAATQSQRIALHKLYKLKAQLNSNPENNNQQSETPTFVVSKQFAENLLGNKKAVLDSLNSSQYLKNHPQAFELEKRINIHINRKSLDVSSPNLIGIIQGIDTAAGYIVFTAHRDHEGQADGSTWYRADDNASGSAALMECEKAISDLSKKGIKPKRSIIFISTTAEEHGLLGAKYFAENSVVPLNKIKYELNIDMLGRIDSKHVDSKSIDTNYVYPLYYDSVYNFKPVLDNVNTNYTNLTIDDYYLKHKMEQNMILRSDQAVFAKKGIPAIWFFTGIHKDYHQPTDTPDKINYDLLQTRTKLVLGILWKLAN